MRKLFPTLLAALAGVAVAYAAKLVLPSPSGPAQKSRAVAAPSSVPRSEPIARPEPVARPATSVASHYRADETPGQPLHLRGYIVRGRAFNALLSDGRTLTERDGLVQSIERNGVRLKDGTFYAFRTTGGIREASKEPEAKRLEPTKPESAVGVASAYRGEALFEPSPGIGMR